MNINIPFIECYVRVEYLRQHRDSHGKTVQCIIFGMASLIGQVPLFHFVLEDGGIWWRMPISAFCHKPDAKHVPLDELMLWDSFSYTPSITRFSFLMNKRMQYISRSGKKRCGRYMFTIDWHDPTGLTFAEEPGQHKCGHVIELDDGNFAIQPNNRLVMFEPAFTTRIGEQVVHRLISDRLYTVEDRAKWKHATDDSYDFTVEPQKGPPRKPARKK